LHHDQVAPLLLAHFDEGISFANRTSVPEFVHVLMTIISFLNPSVIWQHLNEEYSDNASSNITDKTGKLA